MDWAITKAGDKSIIISHELGSYSFIVAQNNKSDLSRAVIYGSEKFTDASELESCLSEIVQQYSVQKASCNVVMRTGTYSHLLVDKPMVPAKEMADAVEWVTKDLVKDLPYETPLLSHFYGSELSSGKEQNKLHIVVAEQSTVTYYHELIMRQGLKLGTMTIEELAAVKMLRKDSEDCVAVYLALGPEKSNSAIFVLNNQLLGIKRLPAVALDSAVQKESFSELWQGLQQSLEHYLQSMKKNYTYKVMLSPCSSNNYSSCNMLLQETFVETFGTNIEIFDVKSNFYAGPMADDLCQKNNVLLLGAC
jgi:MSHA biogenesis protein MshI